MAETVFSSVKRSLGCALRARTWCREFREVPLMCAVYNIKKAAKTADSNPLIRLNAGALSEPALRKDFTIQGLRLLIKCRNTVFGAIHGDIAQEY